MGLLVLVVIRVTRSEGQRDIERYIQRGNAERETHFFDLAIANVVQFVFYTGVYFETTISFHSHSG